MHVLIPRSPLVPNLRRWRTAKNESVGGAIFLEVFVSNPRGVSSAEHEGFSEFCQVRGYNLMLNSSKGGAPVLWVLDCLTLLTPVFPAANAYHGCLDVDPAAEDHRGEGHEGPGAESGVLGSSPVTPMKIAQQRLPGDPAVFPETPVLATPRGRGVQDDLSSSLLATEGTGEGIAPRMTQAVPRPLVSGDAEAAAASLSEEQRHLFESKPLLGSRSDGTQDRTMRTIPDESEIIELSIPDVIATIGGRTAVGTLFLTDYRLVMVCNDGAANPVSVSSQATPSRSESPQPDGAASQSEESANGGLRLRKEIDLSFCLPLGLILEAQLADGQKRHVAHRVDPAEGGGSAARLAALFRKVPRASQSANAVLHMTIETRDFRSIGLLFTAAEEETCNSIHAMARGLQDRLSFVIANWSDIPAALTYGRSGDPEDWYL